MTDTDVPAGSLLAKRVFDVGVSAVGLVLLGWLIVLAVGVARLDTGLGGVFRQARVGLGGRTFWIYKIRTMSVAPSETDTTVTADGDPRITRLGRWFRKTKIDELPQLWNVLRGDMSLVGPRPDVAEMYDFDDPVVQQTLRVRPGITGPATLAYRKEEELLAAQDDPERYFRDVVFPDKVRINAEYVRTRSFLGDLGWVVRTILG